jgi:chromosome segregation ATPase
MVTLILNNFLNQQNSKMDTTPKDEIDLELDQLEKEAMELLEKNQEVRRGLERIQVRVKELKGIIEPVSEKSSSQESEDPDKPLGFVYKNIRTILMGLSMMGQLPREMIKFDPLLLSPAVQPLVDTLKRCKENSQQFLAGTWDGGDDGHRDQITDIEQALYRLVAFPEQVFISNETQTTPET